MVIDREAASSHSSHLYMKPYFEVYKYSVWSLQKGWILQTNYAFSSSDTLLLARASWNLSMKVKILNAKLFF